jgi:uncharacterized coiled-coil protein SlyX
MVRREVQCAVWEKIEANDMKNTHAIFASLMALALVLMAIRSRVSDLSDKLQELTERFDKLESRPPTMIIHSAEEPKP